MLTYPQPMPSPLFHFFFVFVLILCCFVENIEGREFPLYTPLLDDEDVLTKDFLGEHLALLTCHLYFDEYLHMSIFNSLLIATFT